MTAISMLVKHYVIPALFFVWLAGLSMVLSAQELTIAPGATYDVSELSVYTKLERLVVGDGATLVVPDFWESWTLDVVETRIGKDVHIMARGYDSADLEPLKIVPRDDTFAQNCDPAEDGETGAAGTNGGSGKAITLRLGLVSFGSLVIDARGGSGGVGGFGGDGQHADASGRCGKMPGGAAGSGGRGGDGGAGGVVRLVFSSATPSMLSLAREQSQVFVDGGAAGAAGTVGRPGNGSPGGYVQRKTLTGNKKWVGGGKQGFIPASAKKGVAGAKGFVDFVLNNTQTFVATPVQTGVATTETAAQSLTSEALVKRLEVMEDGYRQLLQRIERLERDAKQP